MHKNDDGLKYISLDRSFTRLLMAQGIVEIGDNLRLMAVTMLLLKLTGSGMAAGFSLVMTPIVGIVLSPLAGVLGDGLEGRKFLSTLYLLQGALVTLFINGIPLRAVYIILIFFAGIQIIQDPIYKKMIRDSLQNSHIIVGNSLSTGVSGFSNLVGPILGGIGIQLWGMDKVLVVSSIAYIVSSFIVLSVDGVVNPTERNTIKSLIIRRPESIIKRFLDQMREGIKYFWRIHPIREIGLASFIFFFGSTSVSFAFYSLAFDVMGITAGGWGFILSIFYSTRLLAMLISILMDRGKVNPTLDNILLPLFSTCLSWLLYGLTSEISYIVFALVMEGTSHFIFEIIIWTRLQLISKRTLVARMIGINNILSNAARIMGIILAYIIIQIYSIQAVFIVNGIFIFIYAFYKGVSSQRAP